MTSTECTLYDLRGDAAWITLNRPEARNALSEDLMREVSGHLSVANDDPAVRAIVITGAGKAFCAGADLKNRSGPSAGGGSGITFDQVLLEMWHSAKPVIAAINGPAFGGGLGLVAAADIAISVEGAKFSFSEVRIGVIPAIISVVCLRKLGSHHGMRLFLTGERFDAGEAVDYGLIHRAVAADALDAAVAAETEAIRLGGPNAVAECKKLVRRVSALGLEEGFELTRPWSERLFRSEEATEGMTAFAEKRKPSWVDASE